MFTFDFSLQSQKSRSGRRGARATWQFNGPKGVEGGVFSGRQEACALFWYKNLIKKEGIPPDRQGSADSACRYVADEAEAYSKVENNMKYIGLVYFKDDEFEVATANTQDEAKQVLSAGFDYVAEKNGIMLFRRPKRFSAYV
jgi:hypothetical protein